MRTAKGGTTRKGPDFPAFWEARAGGAAADRRRDRGRHQLQADPRDQHLCALVLVVQSLPFLAAVAIAAIEGSRFNEFAYWRSVEAKVAETAAAAGGASPPKRRAGRSSPSRTNSASRRLQ